MKSYKMQDSSPFFRIQKIFGSGGCFSIIRLRYAYQHMALLARADLDRAIAQTQHMLWIDDVEFTGRAFVIDGDAHPA